MKAKFTEGGEAILREGETLTQIEQEGFGIICAIADYEGESVYRILRALNAHENLLESLRRLTFAAACRENTMGDPCRLIECQGELRAATKAARDAIANAEGAEQ